MMYDDYLSFGGVEIANSARAKAYAESASCPVYWIKTEACQNLPVALSHLPYTSETVYDSPWYDPANSDLSTRFFGVVVVSVKGLSDSSREISTIEGIKDGGVISGQRRGSRRARYRLALIARGADALEYGINWLSSKLDGQKCGQHGTRCGTSDLQFFADCPPPMEFDYTFDPDPSRTVRNLFPNPNLVGDGTYATVAENLFTNPRLTGDGTWAEVRRNLNTLSRRPQNWTKAGNRTLTPVEDSRFRSVAVLAEGTGWVVCGGYTVEAGDIRTVSVRHTTPTGAPPTSAWAYFANVTAGISGGTTTGYIDHGDGTFTSWATREFTGAGSFQMPLIEYVQSVSGVLLGDPMVEAVPGPPKGFFDGAVADFTVDPDMRTRWIGNENTSQSVMEIERVSGFTVTNAAIPGVSTWEGKPAVRIIPYATTSSNQSVVAIPIPESARASGTMVGTIHIGEPTAGPQWTAARSLRASSPIQVSAQAPNEPGDYPLRFNFSGQGSSSSVGLTNGASTGNGDVWWTDIGIFAGNYPYEYFNGESAPEDTGIAQPEDFRIRWSGEVDNSRSVMEIEQVAGMTSSGAIAGVSSREGKPAVRIIPTGTTASHAQIIAPASAREGATWIGTVHLDAPLTGELSVASRSLYSREPARRTGAPNSAGSYPLRLSVPTFSSANQLRLYNGGHQGAGDVWWTDIGLFEGDYTGEWFTGDFHSTPAPNINPTIYTWEGVPNNSVSRREHGQWIATENPDRHRLLVNEVTRFMHDVGVSSGPLLIEEYEKGGVNAAVVEVNFQSERGYIYGAPRELNLDAAELSSVNDVGINLIPNPRGRKKSTTDSTIARNAVTNPSFETNLTGWAATVGTISRPFQELRARGDYSLKIATTGLTAIATHSIAVASRSSASRAVLGVWVALTSSGAKVPSSIELVARSYGTIYGSRIIPTPTANSGQYYTLDVEGVPTSGDVEIAVDARWTGGTTQNVSMYIDTVMFLQDG